MARKVAVCSVGAATAVALLCVVTLLRILTLPVLTLRVLTLLNVLTLLSIVTLLRVLRVLTLLRVLRVLHVLCVLRLLGMIVGQVGRRCSVWPKLRRWQPAIMVIVTVRALATGSMPRVAVPRAGRAMALNMAGILAVARGRRGAAVVGVLEASAHAQHTRVPVADRRARGSRKGVALAGCRHVLALLSAVHMRQGTRCTIMATLRHMHVRFMRCRSCL